MNSIGKGALKGFGSNKTRLKTDRLVRALCFPSPFKEKDLQRNLVTAAAQL